MAVTMQLGGQSLGENFPIYGSSSEYVRDDEQGPAILRNKITLAGFLEGDNHSAVLSLFAALKAIVGKSDTTFTFIDGTALHSNRQVWVGAYNEPADTEFGRCRVGDYSIELYYFSDVPETNKGINCSYGGYAFDKTPKFGRSIKPQRASSRSAIRGSTATITLTGTLYGADKSDTLNKALDLQNALNSDQILTYGGFSELCRVVDVNIDPVVPNNYVKYSATFEHYIGEIISLRRTMKFTRVHQFPVVTEEPFCNRRTIDLMNRSGQFITYTLSIEAQSIATARSLLATEAVAIMEPGGIEWPGGDEEWDLESPTVSVNFTKFHSNPVIDNLAGTGE